MTLKDILLHAETNTLFSHQEGEKEGGGEKLSSKVG